MTALTESNTVEQIILDAAKKLGGDLHEARGTCAPAKVPSLPSYVMVEPWLS